MTSNNNQIVWVKVDTKLQYCEIDGVTYVARRRSATNWTPQWQIGKERTFKTILVEQYLADAKKQFARLMAQPMVDQPQPAPVTMQDRLRIEAFHSALSGVEPEPYDREFDEFEKNTLSTELTDQQVFDYLDTPSALVEPMRTRQMAREDYKNLWRDCRMAQLDENGVFPNPWSGDEYGNIWDHMLVAYFNDESFVGWLNRERKAQFGVGLYYLKRKKARLAAQPMVDQPQPAPALSPALTDAETVANAEQHARSIPHAIETALAPVSITEEILTATDSYLTLATNIDDIAAIYEAQDGLAEIVEDAKPLKSRTPHDLAMGVWHTAQASSDLLAPHGLLIRYCRIHGLEYREVRNELVYQVSKDNPKGYTRKEHNLTEHEVKEFIRAVDAFTSQAPADKVQG